MLRHSSRMRELNDSTQPLRHGSPGYDVQPEITVRPVSHYTTGEFGAVVTPQHRRIGTAFGGQPVQFGDHMLAGDAALNHPAKAFTGVLVDNRDDLDRPPIGGTSNWKSTAHTRLGASAVTVGGAVEVPWRLRRRRCGTRSPSSRQSR